MTLPRPVLTPGLIGENTKRAVPEWVGKTPDTAIPKVVKLRVLLAYDGRCHRSKHKFRPGDKIEYDHIIALCNGGENRESNLAPILGGKPHKEKTAADVAERSKVERTRAAHLGLKTRKPGGFRGWRKMNGDIVYRDKRGRTV